LRKNFGEAWAQLEFRPPNECDQQSELLEFILSHPKVQAISTHTLMIPVPWIEAVDILPLLFVRHPIDRLVSAYNFERFQDANTVGANLAKETDFAEYISTRLANVYDRSFRNFQAYRLAILAPEGHSEEIRAFKMLETLPFIGVVDYFSASMLEFVRVARPYFPSIFTIDTWENLTQQGSIQSRLDSIHDDWGDELIHLIVENNLVDFAVYNSVKERYWL
jgi:hypothetical protein